MTQEDNVALEGLAAHFKKQTSTPFLTMFFAEDEAAIFEYAFHRRRSKDETPAQFAKRIMFGAPRMKEMKLRWKREVRLAKARKA